jgi:hypothetical protein
LDRMSNLSSSGDQVTIDPILVILVFIKLLRIYVILGIY